MIILGCRPELSWFRLLWGTLLKSLKAQPPCGRHGLTVLLILIAVAFPDCQSLVAQDVVGCPGLFAESPDHGCNSSMKTSPVSVADQCRSPQADEFIFTQP